ncbi:mechanosensitive ion channel domain-containing protein [Psychromonas sp. SR45-3]|uniref:mechanosensitive ion channel domain-containing protein n=1 Tax=Psychromonas sp. SR45-3 TaxID=2760930 RepID=UPI0015FD208F|nr:mechanosensitive ion channel domain-containing protein [Psychromonas sp. SR45-3]MBB1272284.1 mechanosensitive ion channel [Psychromonas sp. SR45-3]
MSQQEQPTVGSLISETSFIEQSINWFSEHHQLFISHILNIVIAIVIIIVGNNIARGLSVFLAKRLKSKAIDMTIVDFLSAITHYALIIITWIAALGHLGVETASLIAIIGAASLAIGLALKGSLSNFAAGVLLVALRPFTAGNFIEAAGTAGTVESIQLFNCILRTGDNKLIFVPNSAILKGNIVNVSRKPERRIDLIIRVSYQADLKQVRQLLEATVLANEKVLKEPSLQVAVSELASSSVNLVVRPWVKSADYWSVRFALTESIKNTLDNAEIDIPYPQLYLHKK